jgi:NADH:ubiquinone reductase (non-electrogenic)
LVKEVLVVLGSGFGAMSVLRALPRRAYDIIVVSPRNHFLFTPLLPSTAVGTIEFRSIIESVHSARGDIVYYQAHCNTIDPEARSIECYQESGEKAFTLRYDRLVIAVGSASNTYHIPGVQEHALFLKELSDARAIRQKIIGCFERAATPGIEPAERRRLLHFVIVGGGPTGVEFAAELHDLVTEDVRRGFPRLQADVRITLLEAGEQILSTFDEELSSYALRHLKQQRIEVRTRSAVTAVEAGSVSLRDGSEIPYGLLVWSTGIAPTPLIRDCSFAKDRTGRIIVDDRLRMKGCSDIFAIGDCATLEEVSIPATAQIAQAEGNYVGRALARLAQGKPIEPFRYRNLGMLAYIGGMRALADLTNLKGKGYFTYLLWRSAYLTRLVGWRNKILVLFDWIKAFLFGRDISQF